MPNPRSTDFFASPKQRLARAKANIENAKWEAQAYLNTIQSRNVVEPDEQGLYHEHKLRLLNPIVPPSVVDPVVEVIEGLRATLDQAVFCAALASGVSNPGYAAFPFTRSVSRFDDQLHGRAKDAPKEIKALLRSFQPYLGGDDLLWALNEACNTSKHMLLKPFGFASGRMRSETMWFDASEAWPFLPVQLAISSPAWNSAKNEFVFARTAPGVKSRYNVEVLFTVAFGEIESIAGKPVFDVLQSLAVKVEMILRAIEAETRKLGFIP